MAIEPAHPHAEHDIVTVSPGEVCVCVCVFVCGCMCVCVGGIHSLGEGRETLIANVGEG